MTPLNHAERKKAFLNFLIFFTITVTIIITVVFFSIQVPFDDNKRLRDQIAEFQEQRETSRTFQLEVTETSNLLKTLDSKDVQHAAVDAQIEARLTTLNNLIRSVPDSQNIKYLSVLIENLTALKNAKMDLSNLKGNEMDEARLKLEISDLKKQISQNDFLIANYKAQLGLQP